MLPIFLALLVIIFLYWFFRNTSKPPNFPPGPPRLPIIGSFLSVGIPPHEGILKLQKKYGNIFGMFCGNYPAIVLNDLTIVRDAFGDERFSARPPLKAFLERSLGGSQGIIFGSGQKWLEQRKFIVSIFREFGFGKRDAQQVVKEELTHLISTLKKHTGEAVPILHHCHTAAVNALWSIVAGERFNYENEVLREIIRLTEGVLRFRSLDTNSIKPYILFFIPFISKMFPNWTGWNPLQDSFRSLFPLFQRSIQKHRETFDENNIRDLIDVYIQKIDSTKDPDSPFYKENGEVALLVTLVDLFVAGAETSSSNLSWAILHLANNPEYQKKLHDEIDRVIGRNRQPTIADKLNMPLMEACINETLRIATIGCLSIVHSTTEHIPNFHGYSLPKDTIVFGNLWHVNHDEEIWGDPNVFRPERLLGDGSSKISRISVFSKGKRVCPGEGLARDELFLFLTGLLQEFVFRQDFNSPSPCFDTKMVASTRTIPYTTYIELRE